MKKVSVVILNWNGKKLLEQFLPSIFQYTNLAIADIVIADNCSTDDSISFVKEAYPEAKLILLEENYGFAEGYNKALKEIETEYSLLLNSDVEVSDSWLEPLITYMDENADVGAAQPKLLAQRRKSHFEYAGAAGGYLDKYGYPFCRGRIFGSVEEDKGQYDTVADIFWATGACFMIRTADFFKIGGFDSSFFAHMEEIDLCWRLNARGRRVVCVPTSTVYHVGGATLSEESPRKTFLNFRNNLLMLYKNLPEKDLESTLRIRYYLDMLAVLQFYLTGKSKNAKAIRDAYKEFRATKANYDVKRKVNLSETIQKVNTIYLKSILWSFYVKGKKVLSSLDLKT